MMANISTASVIRVLPVPVTEFNHTTETAMKSNASEMILSTGIALTMKLSFCP
jgi:hypothetical protein